MAEPPATWLSAATDSDQRPRLLLAGPWRLVHLAEIEAALRATLAALPAAPAAVDGSGLTGLDSAAALVLLRALDGSTAAFSGFHPPHQRILDALRTRPAPAPLPPTRKPNPLAHLGQAGIEVGQLLLGHLQFLGLIATSFAELLRAPRRLRRRELVAQIEQAGLDAVPVVVLVSALIGIVFTYLLGLQAEKYGANIFVVDGVGIGATRELVPIMVAVIVAGRSGAAFAAELGAMRLAEEIDAIRTLGLSPPQVLVMPRVLALMLMLPLLVFAGDAAALAGSMAIARPMLDLSSVAFLARLRDALELRHVIIGLGKAPLFALAIALIGTRMGMTVGRDTRAVGRATTSTVVQAIVAVIVIDAIAAVVFEALDW